MNDYIHDEFYFDQPPSFINPSFSKSYVQSKKKTLYNLKQAPRYLNDLRSKFLLEFKFQRGKVNITRFKKFEHEFLLVHIFIDSYY